MNMKFTFYLTAVILCFGNLAYAQPASFAPRGVGGGGALFFPRINPAKQHIRTQR